jgi:hypothetical protein
MAALTLSLFLIVDTRAELMATLYIHIYLRRITVTNHKLRSSLSIIYSWRRVVFFTRVYMQGENDSHVSAVKMDHAKDRGDRGIVR